MSREQTAPASPDLASSSTKLCLTFTDRVGIVADIARILSEHAISITAMEVEVEPTSHEVRVYLALDIGLNAPDWEHAQQALVSIHNLQKIEPVHSLPRERHEAWLRLVLDSISDGLLAADEQGQLTLINRAARNLFGLETTAALGRPIDTLALGNTQLPEALAGRPCLRVPHHHVLDGHRSQFLSTTLSIRDDIGRIAGAVEILQDMTELRSLAQAIIQPEREAFANIVGASPALQTPIRLAQQVAPTDVIVCLRGESGTGKELFARAIHSESGRTGEFVAINCAALPSELLESELFGYAGGAFTGAQREGKAGLFELAKDGTLFLDEIGELPPGPQAKLLRVIQEGTLRRVGGAREIPVTARIITATGRNLEQMMAAGEFRQDLFYRINVFPILLPALRERKADVAQLVDHFLFRFNSRLKRPPQWLTGEALEKLMHYDWPGNIRELRNVMERAAILNVKQAITAECVLFSSELTRAIDPVRSAESTHESLPDQVACYEKNLLISALRDHHSIRKTALHLGISHTAVLNKLKKYSIDPKRL
ncbi:MAG: sigma 54-interacting transcriptional regulator [Candidatus Competibacteraceae bacterium]|nr:sigma 54-interacting transcriptional regulator [Candidatus Competibacteraceae bacterium]